MTCLTVALLLLAAPEPAKPLDTEPLDTPPHGFFVGDDWRYDHMSLVGGLFKRTAADLVSIPSGIGGWSGADWVTLVLTLGVTVGFEIPFEPSVDVRLQEGMQRWLGPGHPHLWSPFGDTIIWGAFFSGIAALLAYGVVSHDAPYLETAMLSVEAWLVAQFYINVIKILTGRESPTDEQGQGNFHGPAGFTKYFPAGVPSGHVASIWAVFTVVMQYWQSPLLYVLMSAVGVVLSVATIGDNYHFASESICGAVMGIAIGRWIVRHRSTRYRYGAGGAVERLTLVPMVMPGSGYGAALSFAF
jgi:membrane-associated phospholipid phosphatase